MADNFTVNPATIGGGASFASDDIGGIQHQRFKIVIGADGVSNGDVSAANGMPVIGAVKAITTLLSAITTPTTGASFAVRSGSRTVKAEVTGTGAITATVELYGNHDTSTSTGILLATITLSGTTSAIDGTNITAEWPFMYAKLTAITGTSAAVTCTMGA